MVTSKQIPLLAEGGAARQSARSASPTGRSLKKDWRAGVVSSAKSLGRSDHAVCGCAASTLLCKEGK